MSDPAFLFYDGDAAKDVSHMNRLERGAYFDFIQAQRKFHGITLEQIRKIFGKDFEEVWTALEVILSIDEDGKYYIEWVRNSEAARAQFKEKQRLRIQDYWDKKKSEESKLEIPRNNYGKSVDLPLVNENENENKDNSLEKFEKPFLNPKEKKGNTWRDEFFIYVSELNKVYDELIIDKKYISEQEKFHPNVDIKLSLEKAVTNFWGTEAGWKHKKSKKSKDLNWKSTLTNAIDMNKVYKQQQQPKQTEIKLPAYKSLEGDNFRG